MANAKNIFIRPLGPGYLLITVMEGRGRAYWTLTKNFPDESAVKDCLSYGEGLREGGVDEMLDQVFDSFKRGRKDSFRIEELITAAKL